MEFFEQATVDYPWLLAVLVIPYVIGLAAAGVIDVGWRVVPNRLVAALLVLGITISVVLGGWLGLEQALLGGLVGGALLIVPFVMGATGGGDVKLLAALGTVTGPVLVLKAFLVILAIGVVVSIVNILYRRAIRQTWVNIQLVYFRLLSLHRLLSDPVESRKGRGILRDNTLPFGAVIALGGELVLALHCCGVTL